MEEEYYDYMNNNSGVELYIKELMEIPMLTEEEKQELPILISKGDIKAKKRFVEANLRLVVYEVNNFMKNYFIQMNLFEELISVGNEALVKAVETFDYKKGIKFSTYAIKLIDNKIYSYYLQNTYKFKFSHNFYHDLMVIEKYLENEKLNNKNYVNIDEISKNTGISYKTICIIFDILKPVVYLDKPAKDEDDCTVGDLIEDERVNVDEKAKYLHDFYKVVINSDRITKRQLKILLYRTGFYNNRVYSLKELSKMFNITPSGVNSVYKSSIKKLLLDSKVLSYAPDSYKI